MGREVTLTDLELSQCRELIMRKARRFFGRRLSHHELEDVCGDTMVEVLIRLSKYDPARSSVPTYVDRIIGSSIVDIARSRAAVKNGGRIAVHSLNARVYDADGDMAEYWQTLDERLLRSHMGGRSQARSDASELAIDLKRELAALTGTEKELLVARLSGATASELAERYSVCRGTIYRRLEALGSKLRRLVPYAE